MPTDSSLTANQTLPTDTSPPDSTPRDMLIVEDDKDLAGLMREWGHYFYGGNISIHVEHTVAESLATLESLTALDIAVLDRTLPDGTGEDLLQVVTSQFDAVTLMITGVSPDSEIIKLPINDYIVKPIDEETFLKQLSLLEKLKAANTLEQYSDARKASLLEYHLDTPEENPLFRRFAARWSYDHLEIAHFGTRVFVYELYTGTMKIETISEDGNTHVSITGTLATDLENLLNNKKISPVGELVPSGKGYAWMETEGDDLIDIAADSIGIYQFTCDAPEQYITDIDTETDCTARNELTDILETEFN